MSPCLTVTNSSHSLPIPPEVLNTVDCYVNEPFSKLLLPYDVGPARAFLGPASRVKATRVVRGNRYEAEGLSVRERAYGV